MKRIYVIIFMLVMGRMSIMAQDWVVDTLTYPYPYTENFDNSFKWGMWDFDGDTTATIHATNLSFQRTWPYAIQSVSVRNHTDHWLVSPGFVINKPHLIVEWWMSNILAPAHRLGEHLELLVARGSGADGVLDTSDFDTMIFECTLTETYADFQRYFAELSDFYGDTIHLAFHHNSGNTYWLNIDDVTVLDGTFLLYGIDGPELAYVDDRTEYSINTPFPERYGYEWDMNGYFITGPDTEQVVHLYWDGDYPRGSYDLSCLVTNLETGDTMRLVKRIYFYNCEHNIDDYPYIEDFYYPACWENISTVEGQGWQQVSISLDVDENGEDIIQGVEITYGGNGVTCWLVSPLIEVNREHLELSWDDMAMEGIEDYQVFYTMAEIGDSIDEDDLVQIYAATPSLIECNHHSLLLPEEVYGEAMRLVFRQQMNGRAAYWGTLITNVRIGPSRVPEVDSIYGPRVVPAGTEARYWAYLSSGEELYYYWYFEGGEPEASTEQSPVVKWNQAGTYMVVADISNRWGAQTDTFYVEVTDCGVRTAPYEANFYTDSTCWTSLPDPGCRKSWVIMDSTHIQSILEPNDPGIRLISPAIAVPEEGMFDLAWVEVGFRVNASTMVSHTGASLEDFTDTLRNNEVVPLYPHYNLDCYRGDTIWIAFVHGGFPAGTDYLDLLHIGVYSVEAPRVNIERVRGDDPQHNHRVFTARTLNLFTGSPDTYEWQLDGVVQDTTGDVIDLHLSPGNHTLTLTAINRAGSGSDTIQLSCVGIEDPAPQLMLRLMPNPASGNVKVSASCVMERIAVYTLRGELWQTFLPGSQEALLDVSSWPRGAYMLRVMSSQGVETRKLIVQ